MKLYELEQPIMECWNITRDLQTMHTQLCDGAREPTMDEMTNALMGMQQLYDWKFEQLFFMYEKVLEAQAKEIKDGMVE